MASDERLGGLISEWLEADAPTQVPQRVLRSTFERTRRSRQQAGWRAILWRIHVARFAPALGGAAAVVLVVALALGYYANRQGFGFGWPVATPAEIFVGNWEATDAWLDSSHLTMAVIRLPDGTYDVTIRDPFASVCRGTASTMTGVAEAREPGTIVIARPDYQCDNGSEAQALSGPPLQEQLQDMAFTYDPRNGLLRDSLDLVWSRVDQP